VLLELKKNASSYLHFQSIQHLKEIDDPNIQEGSSTSTSEKIIASNSSIVSETINNEPPIQVITNYS
jgi:hypothetical protein